MIDADDSQMLAVAAKLLPDGEPDTGTWASWTKAIAAETGRKGKGLFMPLRLALTGQRSGPELADLLPLMGRQRIIARLWGTQPDGVELLQYAGAGAAGFYPCRS